MLSVVAPFIELQNHFELFNMTASTPRR